MLKSSFGLFKIFYICNICAPKPPWNVSYFCSLYEVSVISFCRANLHFIFLQHFKNWCKILSFRWKPSCWFPSLFLIVFLFVSVELSLYLSNVSLHWSWSWGLMIPSPQVCAWSCRRRSSGGRRRTRRGGSWRRRSTSWGRSSTRRSRPGRTPASGWGGRPPGAAFPSSLWWKFTHLAHSLRTTWTV